MRGVKIHSDYSVNAYGMVNGMTQQHHGLHLQPTARHSIPLLPRFGFRGSMMVLRSNHFIRGNYFGDSNSNNGDGVHTLIWYHCLQMSYVQDKCICLSFTTASANVRRRYDGRAGRARRHKFLHRQYHHAQPVQDIRAHSNFHPSLNAPLCSICRQHA